MSGKRAAQLHTRIDVHTNVHTSTHTHTHTRRRNYTRFDSNDSATRVNSFTQLSHLSSKGSQANKLAKTHKPGLGV
jgi:transposase-like protein